MKKSFSRVFLGFFLWAKRAQNGSEMTVFKFYQKSMYGITDFVHEVMAKWASNLTKVIFMWEKFCFEVFGLKGTRNGPKSSFIQELSKVNAWNFFIFIFYVKLQYHKDFEGKNLFSWEKRFWDKWDWNWTQMRFLSSFEVSVHGTFLFFFFNITLQQHKGWKLDETCFGEIFVLGFTGIFVFWKNLDLHFLLKPFWLIVSWKYIFSCLNAPSYLLK